MSKFRHSIFFRAIAVVLVIIMMISTYSTAILSVTAADTKTESVSYNDKGKTVTFVFENGNGSYDNLYTYCWCTDKGNNGFYSDITKKQTGELNSKNYMLVEFQVPSDTIGCILTTADAWAEGNDNNDIKLTSDVIVDSNSSDHLYFKIPENIDKGTEHNFVNYSDIVVSTSNSVNKYECDAGSTVTIDNVDNFSVNGSLAEFVNGYELYENGNSLVYVNSGSFTYTATEKGKHNISVKAKDIFNNTYDSGLSYEVIARSQRENFSFANDTVNAVYGTQNNVFDIQPLKADYSDVVYTSSDKAIAEITNGKIKVKKTGEVTITAKAEKTDEYYESSASYKLVIGSGSLSDSVKFSEQTKAIVFGEKYKNSILNLPANAKVSYTSSNEDIVTVDDDGNVTAKRVTVEGEPVTISATITAENYENHNISYKLTIVNASIDISNSKDIQKTYEKDLVVDCAIEDSNIPSGATISYEVISGAEVAKLKENSSELAVETAGEVIVKATIKADNYTDKEVLINVTINKAELKGFGFVENDIKYTYDTKYDVNEDPNTIPLKIKDGYSGTISYEITESTVDSKGNKVAYVDNSGVVKVNSAGTITVTATREADSCYKKATATCKIEIVKGSRQGWVYESKNRDIYLGQTFEIDYPIVNYDGTVKYYVDSESDYSTDKDNSRIIIPKAKDTYKITVTAQEDDRYNAVSDTITLNVNYLEAADNDFTVTGNRVNEGENKFNSVVTVKAKEGYKIALYNEATNYVEFEDWQDQIELKTNVKNPEFVLKSNIESTKNAISDKITTDITLDNQAPTGTIKVEENDFEKLLENITFGFYVAQPTVTIEFNPEEGSFNSDRKIEYYIDKVSSDSEILTEEELEKVEWKAYTEPFKIADEDSYVVYAKFSDDYKNVSYISTKTFVVDNTAPDVTIKYDNNESNGKGYYQSNRTATITVDDDNFVGTTDMVKVKATDVTGKEFEAPVVKWNGNIGTIEFEHEAIYSVEITDSFKDLVGTKANVKVDESTKDAYSFVIDKTNPDNLKITYREKSSEFKGTIADFAENLKDGYCYFDEDIIVEITAEDYISGIDTITYSAVADVESPGVSGVLETTVKNYDKETSGFSVSFEIPAEYKGKVEATVVDRSGRTTKSNEESGIVVSSKETLITLDVLNNAEAKKYNNVSYFNEDVEIKVTVEDVFFDSRNVVITETSNDTKNDIKPTEWTRESGTNKYSANVTLTTEGVKRLDVSYTNNSNKTAEAKFVENIVVDKTAPEVTIKYDNNNSNGKGYYQSERTATITVDDINFVGTADMLDVVAKDVTTKELEAPVVEWNGNIGTIKFENDAHYTVKVTDKFTDLSGTKANVKVDESTKDAYEFVVDKTNPENLTIRYKEGDFWGTIKDYIEKLTGGFIYFGEEIVVEISAEDITSGIETITYSADVDSDSNGVNGIPETTVSNDDNTSSEFKTSFTIKPEYKGKVKATVVDRAGRTTESNEAYGIAVSTKTPEISLEVSNQSDSKEYENISYFNEDVKIKVTVEDVFFDSEKVVITETTDGTAVKMNPTEWVREAGTNKYSATVTLTTEGVKKLDVSYTNNSKITAEAKFVENIVVDKTAPEVTIKYDNNESNEKGYYQSNRTATITVDDINFVGTTDMIEVKAKDVTGKELEAPVVEWNGNIGTIKFENDGHYTVKITEEFVDLTGTKANVTVDTATKDAYEFVVDKTNSENLKITYREKSSEFKGTIQDYIENLTGGFIYFDETVIVEISAEDITSGIETITYSAPVDSDSIGVNGIPETTVRNEAETTSDFVTSFEIPAEYKGKIEATVVDRAGRITESNEACGIAISTKTPEISLEVSNQSDSKEYENISYFNEDVEIKVTVEDVFFNSDKVVITETTDGTAVEMNPTEWIREAGTNKYSATVTLTTEGVKRLDVSYTNNSNITAEAKFVENIVVDKTAPEVTIKYDNNDSNGKGYYQSERTATITVDDINFVGTTDMLDVVAKDVTTKELEAPVVEWNGNIGTIKFENDAHYTVKVTDKFTDLSGTKANVKVNDSTKDAYEFVVDKTNPENLTIRYREDSSDFWGTIKDYIEKLTGGFIYFGEEIVVEITAEDITSGIETITYSADVDSDSIGVNGIPETTVNNNDKTSLKFVTSFEIPAEYKGKVEATVVDRAGRITASNEENGIAVSTKIPEISLEVSNQSDSKEYENISYFNEDVKIKVTVEDVFFNSEKVVITETTDGTAVKMNPTEWVREAGTNKYSATVTLTTEGVKRLDVSYTNNSNKTAEAKFVENIVVDKTAPEVVINYNNNDSLVDGYFYNKERTATITVDDINFVGTTEMVKVTAVDKNDKSIATVPKIVWSGMQGTIVFAEDAKYTVKIQDTFTDLSGTKANVTVDSLTYDAYEFVVDKTAPNLAEITITSNKLKNFDVSNDEQKHDTIKYCNEMVEISIKDEDALTDCTTEYYISSKYLDCSNITDWEKYYGVIKLEPDCKFVIYTKVTDQAGNIKYSTSNIIILDNKDPKIDGISPDIKLNPSSNNPKIDKNGDVLYNGDVIVDYVITDPIFNDSCSGLDLENLKYKVVCDGVVTQSGLLNGTVTEYDNRVGSYAGSIRVDSKLNNSNNVELVVSAVDNATNSSEKTAKLRIDITAPVINVNFDKQPDAGNAKYFNEPRIGTITIQERNFDANDVIVKMTMDGAEYLPDLNWIPSGVAQTDSYTHTATFTLSQDGDYTFDISYVDEASNKAGAANYGNSISPREFTVDLTKPVVTVAFDNNSAQNGNYYNAHRVATITVDEHNFDPTRFDFSCVATNDGATSVAPTLSSWSNAGDIHTATVNFNTDSKFTLQVGFTDMAGNVANEVPREEFYVDTTAPEIVISGINDHSANNGKDGNIGFVITASDININTNTFVPEFVRVDMKGNNKSVLDLGVNSNINNGITYTVENISDDGIYTVSCEITDMAGNVTRKSFIQNEAGKREELDKALFSVNRQGSTFMLDEETRKIVDLGYVQNIENDIVITEINPDKVEKYVVTVERGSDDTRVLSYGENYTRQENVVEGTWNTYSYVVKASNFSEESAYKLAISTTDSAKNTSYSETKNPTYSNEPLAKVNFIVDRTIPEVVVTNLESNGHYNVEKQVVNIVANDDNLLSGIKIVLNDEIVKEYTEEELSENSGKMTLDINSLQSLQNLEIIAVDAANNSTSDTEETKVVFENFLVTTNLWIQFINNPIAVIIAISSIVLLSALIIFIIAKKRSKKEA